MKVNTQRSASPSNRQGGGREVRHGGRHIASQGHITQGKHTGMHRERCAGASQRVGEVVGGVLRGRGRRAHADNAKDPGPSAFGCLAECLGLGLVLHSSGGGAGRGVGGGWQVEAGGATRRGQQAQGNGQAYKAN